MVTLGKLSALFSLMRWFRYRLCLGTLLVLLRVGVGRLRLFWNGLRIGLTCGLIGRFRWRVLLCGWAVFSCLNCRCRLWFRFVVWNLICLCSGGMGRIGRVFRRGCWRGLILRLWRVLLWCGACLGFEVWGRWCRVGWHRVGWWMNG